MRLLVCGGRDYDDRAVLVETLDRLHLATPIAVVITGACRTGADRLAAVWAASRRIPLIEEPSDWDLHGRAAGPIRNRRMIDEHKPDAVLAFPGGRGTADMIRCARANSVRVLDVAALRPA